MIRSAYGYVKSIIIVIRISRNINFKKLQSFSTYRTRNAESLHLNATYTFPLGNNPMTDTCFHNTRLYILIKNCDVLNNDVE